MKSNLIFSALIIALFTFGALFLFYYFGKFIILFNNNQCYSHVISNIGAQVDKAVKSGEKEDLIQVKKLIDSMPLRGYESDCDEIFDTFKSL